MKLHELIGFDETTIKKCKLHFATGESDWSEAFKAFVEGKFKEWQETQTKKNLSGNILSH